MSQRPIDVCRVDVWAKPLLSAGAMEGDSPVAAGRVGGTIPVAPRPSPSPGNYGESNQLTDKTSDSAVGNAHVGRDHALPCDGRRAGPGTDHDLACGQKSLYKGLRAKTPPWL
jgi:hypothetical protein